MRPFGFRAKSRAFTVAIIAENLSKDKANYIGSIETLRSALPAWKASMRTVSVNPRDMVCHRQEAISQINYDGRFGNMTTSLVNTVAPEQI